MSVRSLTCCLNVFFPVLLAAQPLVVTEIMADPTPSRGLPLTEYLELYNAGPEAIPLSAISVASGGRATSAGESGQLEPGAYVLLVPVDSLSAWSALDVEVSGMALPTLTNTQDVVTVLVRGDTAVHLRYTIDWYRDPSRDDGGYSLEYNGLGPQDCPGSWRASEARIGGTPGTVNSLAGTVLDSLPPRAQMENVGPEGFDLVFDEAISFLPQVLVNGMVLSPAVESSRVLSLAVPIEEGLVYRIAIAPDFSDCSGNFAADTVRLDLLLPAPLSPGDLLINEVLFDPVPGGSDFVELLNHGPTTVDLRGLQLENRNSGSKSSVEVTYYLSVGDRVVLTEDTADLRLRFPNARPAALVQVDLPALPNAAGNLTVVAPSGTVLDAFDYRQDLHDPLLSPTEGVSLERLDPDQPTQDPQNWYSAATAVGYGTPTLVNSQRRPDSRLTGTQFLLPEPTFAPGGLGLPTALEIRYRTDRPGLQARLRVFDAEGRPVRTLQEIKLLASGGTTYWDGADDNGSRLPSGPYIILIEVVSPEGRSDRYKLVGTLAG